MSMYRDPPRTGSSQPKIENGLNFTTAGVDGPEARQSFQKSLQEDLADAAALPATSFKVHRMSPGSIVDVQVLPYPDVILADVATNLRRKVYNPRSENHRYIPCESGG